MVRKSVYFKLHVTLVKRIAKLRSKTWTWSNREERRRETVLRPVAGHTRSYRNGILTYVEIYCHQYNWKKKNYFIKEGMGKPRSQSRWTHVTDNSMIQMQRVTVGGKTLRNSIADVANQDTTPYTIMSSNAENANEEYITFQRSKY